MSIIFGREAFIEEQLSILITKKCWIVLQRREKSLQTLVNQIKTCIERKLDEGFNKFILFPFGDVGMQVQYILEAAYGMQPAYILDNHLHKYNPRIHKVTFLDNIDCTDYCLILTCSPNSEIYVNLKQSIQKYFPARNIAELSSEWGGWRRNVVLRLGSIVMGHCAETIR